MNRFKNKKWILKPGFLILLCMFGASMAYCYWPEKSRHQERQRFLSKIPTEIADWRMNWERELTRAEKIALGAEDYVLRTYVRGSDEVMLYVAFFTSKHGNITHNPEKCYPGNGFHITRRAVLECSSRRDDPFPAIRVVPIRDEEKILVLYWFQEGNDVIVDKVTHVWRVLKAAIIHNRTESFMVRVSMPFESDKDMEIKTPVLIEFANLVRGELSRILALQNESHRS